MACVLGVLATWWGGLNQDEGWYLYAARLVREGFVPYRDFFFTQGPTMPYVYSVLAPIWGAESPLRGLLGGRVVTGAFGLAASLLAVLLARRLAAPERRGVAALAAFAALACNLYHVYFNTIPKTYALGGAFLLAGFWLTAVGLGVGAARRPRGAAGLLALGGLLLALASGTRISLVLTLGVAGVGLLVCRRRWGLAFLWFGLGGALGLALTYGVFSLDPVAREGLLAAQKYHAARGGFDPFFAVGSLSRWTRGYAALAVLLFLALGRVGKAHAEAGGEAVAALERPASGAAARAFAWIATLSFAAVFFLQLSAPFPYDDYQVPITGLLAAVVAAFFANAVAGRVSGAWFAVLVAGMSSFCSPLLQDWATYGQDRFWSRPKEMTELAKLRLVAEEIEYLDPGGTELLTQDLYLAVETGRRVPRGFEMGPFCYFPELRTERADALHVLSDARMEEALAAAPCRLAAFSGYGFAIAAPQGVETSFERQKALWGVLKNNYELVASETNFGQNATTLLVLRRREPAGAAKATKAKEDGHGG